MTFWSCRKNGVIRKINLTSKFLTSQPGQQTVTIHVLSNISRSKGNHIMKLGQLIEYNKRYFKNFNFSEKGLELVSQPHFVYDFSRKCFSC